MPPDDALYQSIVSPDPGLASMVIVPVPHREPFTAVGATGSAFTVKIAAFDYIKSVHVPLILQR